MSKLSKEKVDRTFVVTRSNCVCLRKKIYVKYDFESKLYHKDDIIMWLLYVKYDFESKLYHKDDLIMWLLISSQPKSLLKLCTRRVYKMNDSNHMIEIKA